MSVLIQGMNMPKEVMLLAISPDGTVDIVSGQPDLSYITLSEKAVSIPPHGRLGDLNALSKEVDRICARYDACIIDELTCAKQLVYAFSSLPTIKTDPAEEGEA